MAYEKWQARLDGKKVETFLQPQLEDAGYYRKPIKNKLPNGQWETVGWIPVALWVEGRVFGDKEQDVLCGLIGAGARMRDMTPKELGDEELWSYIANHPISYGTYKMVAEEGKPWPDSQAEQLQATIPAANREVEKTDNKPAEELPLHVQHKQAIDSACGVAKAFKIASEKEAEQGLGIKNRLAELRLAAKRDGEAAYKPHYNEYARLYAVWNPMIGQAEAEETSLNTKLLTWRETERKRIAAEQAKTATEAAAAAAIEAERVRAEQEVNERAADRAIANGDPEPPPLVTAPERSMEQVAQNQAPPLAAKPLTPTYGKRRLKEEEKTFLDETKAIDFDALFAYFKDTAEVQMLLKTLALAAVRAGREVPGVTTRKGLI
jgi:hypothetical protein